MPSKKISDFTKLRNRIESWVNVIKQEELKEGKQTAKTLKKDLASSLGREGTTSKENWRLASEMRRELDVVSKKEGRATTRIAKKIVRIEMEDKEKAKWQEGPKKKKGVPKQKVASKGGRVISPKGGFGRLGKAQLGGGPKVLRGKHEFKPID